MTTRIDWLRVSIEGVVIVASILLAFGIDAWWDGRQSRNEETEILRGLEVDFAANVAQVTSIIDIHLRNEAMIARLESMTDAELAARTDSVGIYLHALWAMPTFDARDGTLDGAIASGKLALIRDSELRDRLVEWKARVEDSAEEAGELRAAAGRVLERITELGGPWGGETPGAGAAFTTPVLADLMRSFPSGSLAVAANDANLMGTVREKRLRAILYLAALLSLSDQAEQIRGIIGSHGH